jgi:hypothetical protein
VRPGETGKVAGSNPAGSTNPTNRVSSSFIRNIHNSNSLRAFPATLC